MPVKVHTVIHSQTTSADKWDRHIRLHTVLIRKGCISSSMESTWNTPNCVYLKQYLSINTQKRKVNFKTTNIYQNISPHLQHYHHTAPQLDPLEFGVAGNQFKFDLCDFPLQFTLLLKKRKLY